MAAGEALPAQHPGGPVAAAVRGDSRALGTNLLANGHRAVAGSAAQLSDIAGRGLVGDGRPPLLVRDHPPDRRAVAGVSPELRQVFRIHGPPRARRRKPCRARICLSVVRSAPAARLPVHARRGAALGVTCPGAGVAGRVAGAPAASTAPRYLRGVWLRPPRHPRPLPGVRSGNGAAVVLTPGGSLPIHPWIRPLSPISRPYGRAPGDRGGRGDAAVPAAAERGVGGVWFMGWLGRRRVIGFVPRSGPASGP